jgi:hypothetical protein
MPLDFARGQDLVSKAKPSARTSGRSGFLKPTIVARGAAASDMILKEQAMEEQPPL